MHRIPGEIPQHKTKNIKLMAIVHRLQQIMVNENLTPDELVGCAEMVGIITDGLTISVDRKLRYFDQQTCLRNYRIGCSILAISETCFQRWRG